MRTRVKICGITRVEDAAAAVAAGADAIGLVFYPPSPRFVGVEQAASIARSLPPFITKVGLFVDAERGFVDEILDHVGIDLIQFHGDETPEDCAGYSRPWIKAIRMKDGVDPVAERHRFAAAAGLLLDAYLTGTPGGTGATFDWQRVPRELAGEIILAGGLTPANVAAAVQRLRPYAVDVSGGVEASKGIKDPIKINQFMKGVKVGDQ